jgi:exopolyphosphatase/guanosine-5'-triphosphate,3'-diphosphate pyrophosphatase
MNRHSNDHPRTLATKALRACERQAVLDVGTNSVKLLVADVSHGVSPILKMSRQTLLGEGAFLSGRLRPEAIARTVTAVAELATMAKLYCAAPRVMATSATREAANGHELVAAIFRATGLNVEILTGDQEAEYVFQGVRSSAAIVLQPMLIVDVGGGSTEWIVADGGCARLCRSTKLGTSRLLEMFPPSDPPTRRDLASCRRFVGDFLREECSRQLRRSLRSCCGRQAYLVGLGGGLKSLWRLLAPRESRDKSFVLLSRKSLNEQVERLWGMSRQQRRELPGLNPVKADLILAGAVIYEAIMRELDFSVMIRGSQGLLFGALVARLVEARRTGGLASDFPLPATRNLAGTRVLNPSVSARC